jgi:uncharacterized membrane protein YgcG
MATLLSCIDHMTAGDRRLSDGCIASAIISTAEELADMITLVKSITLLPLACDALRTTAPWVMHRRGSPSSRFAKQLPHVGQQVPTEAAADDLRTMQRPKEGLGIEWCLVDEQGQEHSLASSSGGGGGGGGGGTSSSSSSSSSSSVGVGVSGVGHHASSTSMSSTVATAKPLQQLPPTRAVMDCVEELINIL